MPKGVYIHDEDCLLKNLQKAIQKNTGSKHSIKHRKAISKGVKKSYENNDNLRKLRIEIFKKSRTPELYIKMVETRRKNKSYIVSKERKEKQRKAMKNFFDVHPEKHPNRRMANRKYLFSQTRLFNWIKEKFPDAVMEYRIFPTRRFADIAIPSLKIDIEFDGKRWHKENNDEIRDIEINKIGWNILRFDNSIFKIIQKT